jgi:hypothetical protein
MTPVEYLLQGGGATGGLLLAGAWLRNRLPGRTVRASVTVSDEATDANTAAVDRQTHAVEQQTRESRKVAEKLGNMGGQLAGLTGAVGDLRTEIHGLREDMAAMDRRVVRLEAQHEQNGHHR